jgi:hypothetical protein
VLVLILIGALVVLIWKGAPTRGDLRPKQSVLRDPDTAPPALSPDLILARSKGRSTAEWLLDRTRAVLGERPVRFVILSDLNDNYGSLSYNDDVHAAVGWIATGSRPDLVLAAGDMVAGQREGLQYTAMWHAFHKTVTLPLQRAGIPFAPVPGNHDASIDQRYSAERATYVREWRVQKPSFAFVDDEHYPLRYAFRIDHVLFVALDSTRSGALDEEQHRWLRNILRSDRESAAKIVVAHVPFFPFASGRERQITRDSNLESILHEENVTAFVSGHHHSFFPGLRENLRIIGAPCLGSGPRALIGTEFVSDKGLIVGTIYPSGHLEVEAFQAPAFDERISRTSLPKMLQSGRSKLVRDDVELRCRSLRDAGLGTPDPICALQ